VVALRSPTLNKQCVHVAVGLPWALSTRQPPSEALLLTHSRERLDGRRRLEPKVVDQRHLSAHSLQRPQAVQCLQRVVAPDDDIVRHRLQGLWFVWPGWVGLGVGLGGRERKVWSMW